MMNSKETALKVKMLQDILKSDFGITSDVELIEAIKNMQPVDISIFVSCPHTEQCAT